MLDIRHVCFVDQMGSLYPVLVKATFQLSIPALLYVSSTPICHTSPHLVKPSFLALSLTLWPVICRLSLFAFIESPFILWQNILARSLPSSPMHTPAITPGRGICTLIYGDATRNTVRDAQDCFCDHRNSLANRSAGKFVRYAPKTLNTNTVTGLSGTASFFTSRTLYKDIG